MSNNMNITSLEAAALMVSGGQTTDVEEANLIASGQILGMDALQRAHLRRMMGFDFDIDVHHNRFVITDKQRRYKTSCFYSDLDDKAVKRLVRACLRLKKLHDEAK